jgi:hypothetical protein
VSEGDGQAARQQEQIDRDRLKRREAVLAEIHETRKLQARVARRHAQLARIRQALQTRDKRSSS